MRPEQKSTGWKVPLIFCAAILGAGYLAHFFTPARPALPNLPQDLIAKAQSITINLDTSSGKIWNDRIVAAASGFSATDAKSPKLLRIFDDALAEGRLDAACAAVVHMRDEKARKEALTRIYMFSLKNCETLPWSVFAVTNLPDQAEGMASEIAAKWIECRR